MNSSLNCADADGRFPCELIGKDVEGVFPSCDVTFWHDGRDAGKITGPYMNPGPSKCHPDADAPSSLSQTFSSTIHFHIVIPPTSISLATNVHYFIRPVAQRLSRNTLLSEKCPAHKANAITNLLPLRSNVRTLKPSRPQQQDNLSNK